MYLNKGVGLYDLVYSRKQINWDTRLLGKNILGIEQSYIFLLAKRI